MAQITLYQTLYCPIKQTHTAFMCMSDAISGAILYTKAVIL